jgi:hypothetical protein
MTFFKGENFMGNNFSNELQAFLRVNSEAVELVVINFNICNAHHYAYVPCRHTLYHIYIRPYVMTDNKYG